MSNSTMGTDDLGKASLEHSISAGPTSLSACMSLEMEVKPCVVMFGAVSPVSESEMASYSGVIRNTNGLRSLWSSVETLDPRTPSSVSIPSLSLPSSLPAIGSGTVTPISLVT